MATQTKKQSTRVATSAKRASEQRRASQAASKPLAGFDNDWVQRVAEYNKKAAERVTELSEQAVDSAKKASVAYLSSYEKAVLSSADSYEKAAGNTQLDWVATMATSQADLTRECVKAYSRAAHGLVS
jgi:hypothetical protein